MVVQIERVLEKLRVGITFRELKNFSVSKLPFSVDALQIEAKTPPVGEKKRVILNVDTEEEKNEYHISSIVGVPYKTKELIIENRKYDFIERIANVPRNVEAIVRLNSEKIVILSQNQSAITRFSKYIREITSNNFNPVPLKIDPQKMEEIVHYYSNITHLKFSHEKVEDIKSISFNGGNLLENDVVKKILSKDSFYITEIGGILPFLENENRFNINHKGRAWIHGEVNSPFLEVIYDIIKKLRI